MVGTPPLQELPLLTMLTHMIDDLRSHGQTQLPTEASLCRLWDVERYHLHKALQTLAREGIVAEGKNRSWKLVVSKFDIALERSKSYTRAMLEKSKTPHSEILGIDVTTLTNDLREYFAEDDDEFWSIEVRRWEERTPMSYSQIRVPVRLTPSLNRWIENDRSLYAVLESRYGIRPYKKTTYCEAVVADALMAKSLEVSIGSPLLKMTHVCYFNDRAFELTVSFLRADHCRVRFDYPAIEGEGALR